MKSPSIQPRSDTYGTIATNGHTTNGRVSSFSASSLSDRTPLLFSQNQGTSDSISTSDTVQLAIPPADHGKAAWLFLAGCFLTEGLIWGLPFSYGVFQQYYSTHPPFSAEPHNIAAVGTTTTGVIYFVSPVAVLALQRWPYRRLLITVLGLVFIIVGLIAASFANRVSDLIVTQGAIYGIGGALLYNPFVFYLDEWFIVRKGLAFGILWAGTGIGGMVVPVVLEWSLGKYGFRTTLRIWAVVIFVLITPLIYLVKPRLPPPPKGTVRPLNLRFFRKGIFWILQVGNTIEGLGYFMPSIYLPTYASNLLKLSSLRSALLVSVLNLSSVVGTILIGFLTDHLHPTSVILVSALGSALSVFLIWGFALSTPLIYIFALTYGIFAGGYAATWTGCVSEIQRDAIEAEAGVVLGMMAAGRGLGAVMSGPLSETLLSYGSLDLKGAYGTEYGVLIFFTGITAVLGAFGALSRLRPRGKGQYSTLSTVDIRTIHEETR